MLLFLLCVNHFEPELQPEFELIEIDGLEKLIHFHVVDYKYTHCILKYQLWNFLLFIF